MPTLPTLEERRDSKLDMAVQCLRDAFSYMEDVKPMLVPRGGIHDEACRISEEIAKVLLGPDEKDGLAVLAARLKGKSF